MRQSRQRFPAACHRPEKVMSGRARAPVYATIALLALVCSGIFMPSRAGMPTIGRADNVQPGGAGASQAPRGEIPTLNQEDRAQPGEAGISGSPRAAMPMLNQADSAQPPDAGPPSAARDYSSPPAHRPHKATRARPQLKMPPRTGNPTAQLNRQEMVRHQANSQPRRDPVSALFGKLFQ
jgi:hypothetical protein